MGSRSSELTTHYINDLATGLVVSYKSYLSGRRRSLCQIEKVCESTHFSYCNTDIFPLVFDRFNFMTPSLILFYVFILLFCHFISLAVIIMVYAAVK